MRIRYVYSSRIYEPIVVMIRHQQTVSAITTFFLAMTLYPEVQKRAQREIDAVIGTDRFPTIADRDSLPYMRTLVSEVFRWNPIAPLGVCISHCRQFQTLFTLRRCPSSFYRRRHVSGSLSSEGIRLHRQYMVCSLMIGTLLIGILIMVLIRYMLRDPDVYSEPLEFKPERFLGDEPERDPRCAVFGFGRR